MRKQAIWPIHLAVSLALLAVLGPAYPAAAQQKRVVGWALDPQIITGDIAYPEGSSESAIAKGLGKILELKADAGRGLVRYAVRCGHQSQDNNGPHWREYLLEWEFDQDIRFLRPKQSFKLHVTLKRTDGQDKICGASDGFSAWALLNIQAAGMRLDPLNLGHTTHVFVQDGQDGAWEGEPRSYPWPENQTYSDWGKKRHDLRYSIITKDEEHCQGAAWGCIRISNVAPHEFYAGAMYLFRAVYEGDPLPLSATQPTGTGSGGGSGQGGSEPGGGGSGTNTPGSGTGTTGTAGLGSGNSGTGNTTPGSTPGTTGTGSGGSGPGGSTSAGPTPVGPGGTGPMGPGSGGVGPFGTPSGTSSVPPWGPADPATNVSGMTLQAATRRVQPGEEVIVPIWLIKGGNLANLNFNVVYDAGVVVPTEATRGSLIDSGVLFEGNTGEAGIVRIGMAANSDQQGTAPIAQIRFRAVGQPGNRSPLRLEVTNAGSTAGGTPAMAVIDGEVEIVGPDGQIPGDGNGNGVLDPADAMLALKMSVRLIPERLLLDIDKDGKVTSSDARLILQKAVGK